MNCNFFTPVQICNISKDMMLNSKLLSRFDNECGKKNLFDPRPISSRCCNYLNNAYDKLPSSCCYKQEDVCPIKQTELNKIKNDNKYIPNMINSDNNYSIIDFNMKTKNESTNLKSKFKIEQKITNTDLIQRYTNVSTQFKKSIETNKVFNELTKNKNII